MIFTRGKGLHGVKMSRIVCLPRLASCAVLGEGGRISCMSLRAFTACSALGGQCSTDILKTAWMQAHEACRPPA